VIGRMPLVWQVSAVREPPGGHLGCGRFWPTPQGPPPASAQIPDKAGSAAAPRLPRSGALCTSFPPQIVPFIRLDRGLSYSAHKKKGSADKRRTLGLASIQTRRKSLIQFNRKINISDDIRPWGSANRGYPNA
jgi:hypothetical protein